MNKLQHIVEYLITKVGKVNVANPKANSGAVLLKLNETWEEDMERLCAYALHTIQLLFTKDSSDSPAGTATLTSASFKIGQHVHKFLSREPIPWNMELRIGDLFVEAFYNCGYIDLYYPKVRDSSHIISASPRWEELAGIPEALARVNLNYTSLTKLDNISSMAQRVGNAKHSVIKGSTEQDAIDLDQPYVRAINKLQQTGWRINNRVYQSILHNSDMFTSDIPIEDNDAKELKRRSKRVEWSFITSKAAALSSENVFYQLMDADYRGRLYYCESFLNFQGSDLARGMLKFARGKPMTDSGLFWLAVHTAASYNMSYSITDIPDWCSEDYASHLKAEGLDNISVDKMTLHDRVQWTNEYMHLILDAGRDSDLSQEAEKAVSFLACCIEWYDYNCAKVDNRIFMTHLPIPIDGSNNGWQHLGAISKDTHTGELVGLVPTNIQKDFYVQTAKELISLTTDERLISILEPMPMKKIRKGISKRGSMTRAYSAGATKIAENMFFDCKAEDYHVDYGITQDDCTKFAKILIKAIDTVCPGPLQTMAYFQNLASFEIGKYQKIDADGVPVGKEYKELQEARKELYKMQDKTDEQLEELNDLTKQLSTYTSERIYGNGEDKITWTTPSGFNVVYENFIMQTRKTIGRIYGYNEKSRGQVKHVAQVASKMPDIRGFMCGISPNFIHSLDASHMALVIDNWNGDFGAVHDSFSTHASDVEALLGQTKRQFIDMYDVDNFYDYIEDQLITDKTGLDVDQPTLGALNIEEIEDSDYFFA